MRKLIVMSGIPGSGKSTYGQNLIERYGDKVRIVSSDTIRKELTGKYDDFSEDKRMWKILADRITQYGKDEKSVITVLDATCLTNKLRYKWARTFRSYYDILELVVLDVPLFECLKRNKMRPEEKWVPDNTIYDMYCRKEAVNYKTVHKYYDNVVVLSPERKKEDVN